MANSADTVSSLADAFHEAALEPALWRPTLQRFSRSLGDSGVGLADYTPEDRFTLLETTNLDLHRWAEAAKKHGAPSSNRFIGLLQSTPAGRIIRPLDFMTELELREVPVYRELIRPSGFEDGLITPLSHASGGGYSSLRILRKRHFEPREVAFVAACVPHIQRSLEVSRRLSRLTTELGRANGMLDTFRVGVVAMDGTSTILHMNVTAATIIARNDGLFIGRDGRLSASSPGDTAKLKRLIGAAASSATRSPDHAIKEDGSAAVGGGARVSRQSGNRSLPVLVAPLRSGRLPGLAGGGARATVLAFIADPDERPPIPAAALADTHGLTPREAVLVLHLLSGDELKGAAEQMGIAPSTAKTLLQRAFEKTGTRRQSELLSHVLTGPLANWLPR